MELCVRDDSGALPIFHREAGTYSPTRLLSLSKYQEGHAQIVSIVFYVIVLQ
jgi:hypothetical protein